MSGELRERVAATAASLRCYVKESEKARKALEALAVEQSWDDGAQCSKYVAAVRALAAAPPPDLGAISDELAAACDAQRRALRQTLLDRLIGAAEAENIEWRRIGDQPPVLNVGGIRVELDYDKQEARLAYAKEPLARCVLDPCQILEARCDQIARLTLAWPGADELFEAIESAYRARLGREAKPFGERVNLVDLVAELVVEYERRGLCKNATIGRAELAYALDRLAREGGLARHGHRLELGTATGGSTRDKKRVLFLASGLGGGQFYLTLRFAAAVGAEGRS
ncbi:MAG: hypothetical protein QGG14_06460 [Planctomycetota bacterium]|jgi:hypothetical protein|nr:hypothetical protein [Planctomycetota bacterium]